MERFAQKDLSRSATWEVRVHWASLTTMLVLTLASAYLIFQEGWPAWAAFLTVGALGVSVIGASAFLMPMIAKGEDGRIILGISPKPCGKTWMTSANGLGSGRSNIHRSGFPMRVT